MGGEHNALTAKEHTCFHMQVPTGSEWEAFEVLASVVVEGTCTDEAVNVERGVIADEIAGYVIELGTDGRLPALQLEELTAGPGNDIEWVVEDYLPEGSTLEVADAVAALTRLSATELVDPAECVRVLGFEVGGDALDAPCVPRGYRLLSRVPRLPGAIVSRLVEHFGTLQALLAANIDDLMAVEGVGDGRAKIVREGLSRLAEASILERYV